MSDIVQRLRELQEHRHCFMPGAVRDAADEIEHLRAELKLWHDFGLGMAQVGLNGLTVPMATKHTKAAA